MLKLVPPPLPLYPSAALFAPALAPRWRTPRTAVCCSISFVLRSFLQGTESGASGARSAPVQFEADPAEADPFGLDAFLKDAKTSKKK